MTDIERFDKIARERLSERRYHHSDCVRRQAAWLADELGANREKAEIAGILHDICKETPYAGQLQYLDARGILISDIQEKSGGALHAITAPVWIEHELDYHDREVLEAIRWHSTAKPDMNLLEKIIYVSDLTSEDREFPEISQLRAYLPHRIDELLPELLSKVTQILIRDKELILPEGVDAYNYYLIKQRDNTRKQGESK